MKGLPPGFVRVVVHAKARDYPSFVAPNGRKFPSMVKAWDFHNSTLPSSVETLPHVTIPFQTSSICASSGTSSIETSSSLSTADAATSRPIITDFLTGR